MATLVQRRRFENEMQALDAARVFNPPQTLTPQLNYHVVVKEDEDGFWLYLTLTGDSVPDGLPVLPGYERV